VSTACLSSVMDAARCFAVDRNEIRRVVVQTVCPGQQTRLEQGWITGGDDIALRIMARNAAVIRQKAAEEIPTSAAPLADLNENIRARDRGAQHQQQKFSQRIRHPRRLAWVSHSGSKPPILISQPMAISQVFGSGIFSMGRNNVQFQKGLSDPEFDHRYGTEELCQPVVIASRWPTGFQCPGCGGAVDCLVKTRDLVQCNTCHLQTWPMAGTIIASTKLLLRVWLRAIYHLTQTKQGISSVELGRCMGVTETMAWKIEHKQKQIMLEHDATKQLTGRIEIEDAYPGGARSGGKRGHGAPVQRAFVAVAESTLDGKPSVSSQYQSGHYRSLFELVGALTTGQDTLLTRSNTCPATGVNIKLD
jgi:hypothetical protein